MANATTSSKLVLSGTANTQNDDSTQRLLFDIAEKTRLTREILNIPRGSSIQVKERVVVSFEVKRRQAVLEDLERGLHILEGLVDFGSALVNATERSGNDAKVLVDSKLQTIADQLDTILRVCKSTNSRRQIFIFGHRLREELLSLDVSLQALMEGLQYIILINGNHPMADLPSTIAPETDTLSCLPTWNTEPGALIDVRIQNSTIPKPRSVFIMTRRLNQSEVKLEGKEEVKTMKEEHITAECFLGKQRLALTTAFAHWGLFVSYEDDLVSGTLFELKRHGKASVPHQESGKIIRETINGTPRWSLSFRTQTWLTNDKIQELAKGVITKLGEDYDATSRNCQRFSEMLLLCIQRASSQNEVFLGLSDLPHEHAAGILKRRCEEWKAFKAERGLSVLLHTPISPPLTVEAVLHIATPPILLVSLALLGVDLVFRGITWISLLSTLAVGMLLPKANDAVLFYSAKSRALRNRILRKQRTDVVLAELIDCIDKMAVEAIDVQTVISQVLASAVM